MLEYNRAHRGPVRQSPDLQTLNKKIRAQDTTLESIIQQNKQELEALRATVQATGDSISHISKTTDLLNQKVDKQHQILEELVPFALPIDYNTFIQL